MPTSTLQKREKLNQLLRNWPAGTVAVQSWLEKRAISRQLSDLYLKSGWIQKIGQGAFIKAGDKVDWMGGLYALQQQLGSKVHLGGKSLLEIIGSSHFMPLGSQKTLDLYADEDTQKKPLPKWFVDGFKGSVSIRYWPRGFFKEPLGLDLLELPHFSIQVSTTERALMEILALIPQVVSYSHAYLLFQGMETLRPSLVQTLLEGCTSYKVKRLFLHLSKKWALPWVKLLNLEKIDLGQGKRQIGVGGCYDNDYKISVPRLSSFEDDNAGIEI